MKSDQLYITYCDIVACVSFRQRYRPLSRPKFEKSNSHLSFRQYAQIYRAFFTVKLSFLTERSYSNFILSICHGFSLKLAYSCASQPGISVRVGFLPAWGTCAGTFSTLASIQHQPKVYVYKAAGLNMLKVTIYQHAGVKLFSRLRRLESHKLQ